MTALDFIGGFVVVFRLACGFAAFYMIWTAYARRHSSDGLTCAIIALALLVGLK